jgi:hypothetical protein
MKIKLLTFSDPLTKSEIREGDWTPEAFHKRAQDGGCDVSPVSLSCSGMAMMSDEDDNLRLLLICEDGSAAIDISMDAESSEAIVDAVETGRAHMMAQALLGFIDEVGDTKLKEASDLVAAGMFGGVEPGES